eukprot:4977132-Amphidinium_carterae.1
MENSHRFTIEAEIEDPTRRTAKVSSRVDAVVLPNQALVTKEDITTHILLQHAILFVELESGKKGEWSQTQLQLALRVTAAYMSKREVVGVWIKHDFSEARLMRYYQGGYEVDGIFHPSCLGVVATMLLSGEGA